MESFLTNRPHYIQIMKLTWTSLHSNHTGSWSWLLCHPKVMDYNLFHQTLDQLKTVAVAIDKAQSDTTGLTDVWKIFIICKMSRYSSLTKIAFSIISQRPSSHATWLHHGYRGCGLSTKQEESDVEWLIEKDPSYVEAVTAFDAPFHLHSSSKQLKWHLWVWHGGKDCRGIIFQKG